MGEPPADSFSTLIIIIITVGLGTPLVIIIVGGVFVWIRKRRSHSSGYEPINWDLTVQAPPPMHSPDSWLLGGPLETRYWPITQTNSFWMGLDLNVLHIDIFYSFTLKPHCPVDLRSNLKVQRSYYLIVLFLRIIFHTWCLFVPKPACKICNCTQKMHILKI